MIERESNPAGIINVRTYMYLGITGAAAAAGGRHLDRIPATEKWLGIL